MVLASICKTCQGKGYVLIPICDYDGVKYERHKCLDCSSFDSKFRASADSKDNMVKDGLVGE
jgi:hypothetical protein